MRPTAVILSSWDHYVPVEGRGDSWQVTIDQWRDELGEIISTTKRYGKISIPGAFTPTEEVIELARVAGRLGGIYISHMRDEAKGLTDSVRETLAIGEKGGLPTQITHHKVVGKKYWGGSIQTLRYDIDVPRTERFNRMNYFDPEARSPLVATPSSTKGERLPSTSIEPASMETHELEYMYDSGGTFHFMNTSNYDQIEMDEEALGDNAPWMQPGMKIQAEFYEGRPIGVRLPNSLTLEIVETNPVMKTATKTASTKPAKLENGVTVNVPEFVATGDRVRVNPATGEYIERAK